MGYYTKYEFAWEHRARLTSDEKRDLEDRLSKEMIPDYDMPFVEVNGQDTLKWYDCRKDMLDLSRKYPTILFTLSGEGEESGDLWREYFSNGRTQRAEAVITYASFDPIKLK